MRTFEPRRVLAGAAGTAVLAVGLTTAGAATTDRGYPGHGQATARNVILMVGDGLSIAARDATRLATVGQGGERLAMDSLRYAGWTYTDSADPEDAVTDSAAGATAFAAGVRTYNGAVSVDVDGNPVTTLLERAKAQRKATGLVTTSQVTDATPAAFGSHVPDRGDQSEIARQYLEETRPDVILGGGEDWWYPVGDEGVFPVPADDPAEVSKSTIGNLVEQAQDTGYTYVSSAEELAATDADRILGLFANEEMFQQRPEGEGDVYDPVVPLRTMTEKALDVLSQDRHGFFLVVEEEAIDEFAHQNNAERTIQAGQSLDETVALVQEFAARHRGTLVLVVGDHETGGLAIENVDPDDESGDPENPSEDVTQSLEDGPFDIAGSDLQFTVDWTTGGHTGAATPLTAEGPGAERLARAQHATDVHDVVADLMRGRRW